MAKAETLYSLFPEHSRETIDSLIGDPEFEKQIPKLIIEKLEKTTEKILPIDSNLLPLFFSRANFAETEEAYKMANLFSKYLSHQKRFLPLAIDYLSEIELLKYKHQLTEKKYCLEGEDFASRCLFSLSLFYAGLDRLHKKGAPHPGFYREMGKRTFTSIGEENIADNFENWENFIREKAFK